jgi:hypothetical protein
LCGNPAEKVARGASILGTSLRAHPVAAMLAVGDLGIALVYAIYLAGL